MNVTFWGRSISVSVLVTQQLVEKTAAEGTWYALGHMVCMAQVDTFSSIHQSSLVFG